MPAPSPIVSSAQSSASPAPKPSVVEVQESPVIASEGSTVASPTPPSAKEEAKVAPNVKSWNQAALGGGIGIFGASTENSTENKEPTLLEGKAREEVSYEAFLAEWHRLADLQKSENKINLFTLMISNAPRLEGARIEVVIENAIQQELLQNSSIDLLNLLRPSLQNFDLHIVGVQASQNTTRRPYTSSEKYQFMVEKNPLLEELKDSFNLGLDA